MLLTFRNKALERFFETGNSKGIPQKLEKKVRLRLEVIDAASTIDDMRLPGYDLHPLKGERKGTWSIKVSGNWRITFRFDQGNAYDVNLDDYP
jgi:proteic killer suppression protein